MGLLDDAIRQHLELKRQHGAPEEEIQRQEEEALGPARRDVAPAEPSGGDGEVELEDADEAAAVAPEEETELFDATAAEETVLEETELFDAAAAEEAVLEETEYDATAPEATSGEPEDEPADEDELEGVPEPEEMPPSPAPFDADTAFEGFGERDEPDDEDVPEGRREPEGDEPDVLEDTPDFLQETPEHDRLWFEQKPPRDFDFD
jgi:hypothetical protein